MKILPLTEEEKKLLTGKKGRKSDVARPIIDMFLKSSLDMGKVDLSTSEIAANSMILRLRHFVKRYEIPVRVTKRGEEIFLIRLEENEIPPILEEQST